MLSKSQWVIKNHYCHVSILSPETISMSKINNEVLIIFQKGFHFKSSVVLLECLCCTKQNNALIVSNYSNKMKRKACLIEVYEADKAIFEDKILRPYKESMYKNTIWYKSLVNAEKSCLKEDKIRKIHYKFDDEREMVEEYNVDTQVLLRRSWKTKGKLGSEGKWDVEIGDPIPEPVTLIDSAEIIESKDQPIVTRRNTRVNLEWRIRNLPYPIETYCIKANDNEKCIIVSTTNKKYYKKLQVPELARLGLSIEQSNIQSSHKYNTLIVAYKKPQELLDMEKEWYQQLNNVKPVKDIPNECKTQ